MLGRECFTFVPKPESDTCRLNPSKSTLFQNLQVKTRRSLRIKNTLPRNSFRTHFQNPHPESVSGIYEHHISRQPENLMVSLILALADSHAT